MKKKTQTFYATQKEMEMLKFIKENSEANTNAAVFRKGLYHLYEDMQKGHADQESLPQPVGA